MPLNSPWDLAVVADKCYIAMAGSHQIWTLELELLTVGPYAGTGYEGRVDGSRKNAAFAQPSGISADVANNTLYVADSETSSVRRIELDRNGYVSTLVQGDLFDFGDEDGPGSTVRLQHPLALHYRDGKIYLADTYNHKLKVLDIKSNYVRTYLGSGKPGLRDGLAPQFYEPSGLSSCENRLFVTDTNNHAVRVVDLKTHETRTLRILPPQATPIALNDSSRY